MAKRQQDDVITLKHLIPDYHGPGGIFVRWYICLPRGLKVFVGEREEEARMNLSALNKLATLCQSKWRGVTSISITEIGDIL